MKYEFQTMRSIAYRSANLLLLLVLLSVPGLTQEEPYQVGKAGTRRIHCMGQSWKIPVYETSGQDVDDPRRSAGAVRGGACHG